eukprot:766871-Pyramimonas_sp.AAC.1
MPAALVPAALAPAASVLLSPAWGRLSQGPPRAALVARPSRLLATRLLVSFFGASVCLPPSRPCGLRHLA